MVGCKANLFEQILKGIELHIQSFSCHYYYRMSACSGCSIYIYFISMTQDDYYLEMLQYCDRNTLTDGSDVIDYVAA
jgi:hypothetical protein